MKIKSIQLKDNYKRFHDLTIDLGSSPARIVALVGPNGCGKSSVFDGMLARQSIIEKIGNSMHRDYTYHSMTGDPDFSSQSIDINFVGGTFDEIRKQRQPTKSTATMFSFRRPYRYNKILKIQETRATEEIRFNNYVASSASAIDEKMIESYQRLNAKYHRAMREEDCRPSEAKKKIIGELNISIENCLDIVIDNLGSVEENKGSLYFTKYDQPTPFEFDVLSSGEKEVVDILLDLYLRQEDYKETVFLIDEPELHINTAIQKNFSLKLTDLLGRSAKFGWRPIALGFCVHFRMT
jgi:predicted ATP-dependent endonuclease of OLD family